MKVFTMYLSSLCLVAFFLSQTAFAQPVYKALVPGQVITKDGKVRKGKIMVQSYEEHMHQVVFFDEIYIKRVYMPSDIQSYSLHFVRKGEGGDFIKEWKHFESREITSFEEIDDDYEPQFVFFERLVEGPLRLYRQYKNSTDDKNPDFILIVETLDFHTIEVNRNNFPQKAKEIFNHYPEMAEVVGMEGYSFSDMNWMVKNYNVWLSRK